MRADLAPDPSAVKRTTFVGGRASAYAATSFAPLAHPVRDSGKPAVSARAGSGRRVTASTTTLRTPIVLALVWLALASGCARLPSTGVTTIKAKTPSELQRYLLGVKPDLDQFRLRGPFAVTEHKNHEVHLSATERIDADLFLSASVEKAPLVIFLHGHDNSKDDHAYQAMHVASWGMHGLTLQLPNNGPWVANGTTVAKIVSFIQRRPESISSRIDASRLILVGHSFGGAAAAIALAEGAPAAGAILLDPAGVGRELPQFLRRIQTPVIVLGADEQISRTVDREYFYRFIRTGIGEVSIRDATHEDAQYPSELFGIDPFDSEAMQITFVSALTSAAFSLAATGKFDYAWASFGDALAKGRFFNARKK